jgi:hypothetical protein
MRTLDIVVKARAAAEAITGQKAEAVSRCEKHGDAWIAHVEVMEMKGRLADNDMLASYRLHLDAAGDVTSFDRLRQYHRAKGAA